MYYYNIIVFTTADLFNVVTIISVPKKACYYKSVVLMGFWSVYKSIDIKSVGSQKVSRNFTATSYQLAHVECFGSVEDIKS